MAFPANAADLEVCIAYGANLASDLTTLTYSPNLSTTLVQPTVTITRGRIAGAARTQPTTIDLGLKNPGGVFSPRNITGPHYGQLRRNTPIRVRLDPGTGMVTRGIAYLPDWPVRWTGPDIDDRIPMQASGALRRLGVGQEARSALRRSVLASGPLAYWRLEDGAGATSAGSDIAGGIPMAKSGAVNFGAFNDLPGAERAPDLSASGRLSAPVAGTNTAAWTVEFAAKCAGSVVAVPVEILTSGGTQTSWWLYAQVNDTSGPASQLYAQTDPFTFAVVATAPVLTNYGGVWHHFRWILRQSGGNIAAELYTDGVLTTGTVLTATLGKISGVVVNSARAGGTITGSIAHVAVYDSAMTADHSGAIGAYSGELAATRFARLCGEGRPVPIAVDVTAGRSEPMGPQLPGTILDLLRECEDADEATIIERRTGQLGFDPRVTRYNKSVAMTIPYMSVAGLLPEDDDRDLRNYMTVTRVGGSSGTDERVTGALGTDPTTGVDRYPDGFARSLSTDGQAVQHASWLTNVGTIDEPRYVIGLNLRAHPELIAQWLACDIGSRFQVTNPPAIQVGPAPLDLIIEGYVELLDGVEWYVTIYAYPYRPYEVFQIETGTGNRSRIAAGVSTLDLGYSATATSLSVTSAVGRWVDSATYPTRFPMNIEIAGEVMTCTSITGTGLTQTFTVTRGLHGVTKPLPIASQVQIWRPAVIAL